ncbi:T9SS type A sorting domain-containing protein [uncultured Porphyromonas sp.]|uniref:T9SS type A sorting domain-containing protein n=1 Tax=uncultured Porphyromonas sp. TaxID=159274 RepID=UPI0025D2B5D4|nr:T9SS type A sorting domain-containing protein [uncultured Porphyromonas sp.]
MRKRNTLSHKSPSLGLKDIKQLWYTPAVAILLLTLWSGGLRAHGVKLNATDSPDENFRSCLMQSYDSNFEGQGKQPYEETDDSPPTTSVITMTTTASVGSYIMLSVEGEGDIKVEGAELKPGGIAEVKTPQITITGKVISLDCADAQLTFLDLSRASSLKFLWCSKNALTELDTHTLSALSILHCAENQLSALDVTANTNLTELDCSQNKLTQVDLSQCGRLTHFLAYHNQIAAIDLSHNPLLIGIDLSKNKLATLSVTNNAKLETIYCNGNAIKGQAMEQLIASLPDRNDRTEVCHLFGIDTKDKNEQNVISKQNVGKALAKHWETLDYSAGDNDGAGIHYEGVDVQELSPFVTLSVKEDQEVSLKMLGITDSTKITIDPGNGELSTYTINKQGTGWNNFIKPIRVRALGSSMKVYGAIRHFDCSTNKDALTAIELGEAPLLETLLIENNPVASIDLSRATNLRDFSCKGSQTTSLELPNPSSLQSIKCSGTPVATLDLTHQVNLQKFVADGCDHLKMLDLSPLRKITYISMEGTPLTSIDLSTCEALQMINLSFGQLTSLQLSSSQTSLRDIRLKQSQLGACALDSIYTILPNVTEPASILVEGNPGATTAHSDIVTSKGWTIDVTGDGSGCGAIDPVDAPKEGTPYISMGVLPQHLIQMAFLVREITDVYIETKPGTFVKETLKPIVGPNGDYAYTETMKYRALADTIRVYGTLSGIDCSDNKEKLTYIDIAKMPSLQDLFCQNNNLELLDLTRATQLVWLYCGENRLTRLDLSPLLNLNVLDCAKNQLAEIDLPVTPTLQFIGLADNLLDACALDSLFSKLPELPGGLIRIEGNPGATTSTPQIFSDKGWRCDVLGDGTGCPDGPNRIDETSSRGASLSLHPNPASEILYISYDKSYATISLYSPTGELLQRVETDPSGMAQIDVTLLPSGTYYVVAGRQSYQIIVTH